MYTIWTQCNGHFVLGGHEVYDQHPDGEAERQSQHQQDYPQEYSLHFYGLWFMVYAVEIMTQNNSPIFVPPVYRIIIKSFILEYNCNYNNSG